MAQHILLIIKPNSDLSIFKLSYYENSWNNTIYKNRRIKNESRFSKELTFTSLLDIASAKDDEHCHDLEDVDFFCLGKPFHVL